MRNLETKAEIRARILKVRSAINTDQKSASEAGLVRTLCANPKIMSSEQILGYYPKGAEFSLFSFYEVVLNEGIPLYFPRVNGSEMSFYQIASFGDLAEGAFKILEPKAHCKELKGTSLKTLCLVPGIAFDKGRNRIGYGRGYYDKFLAPRVGKITTYGVCFDEQITDKIPADSTDVQLDFVITPSLIIGGEND